MSATQSRTAPADRISCDAQQRWEAEAARQAASNATPQRFVTSGTPHDTSNAQFEADSGVWQRVPLRDNYWPHEMSAADSGDRKSDPDAPDADGGAGSDTGSSLSGLMLERFDDDERWRELARSGRAL